MHPRSKHWHMIDFIITRKRDLQDIKVVKVMRGAECWTDHRLVKLKLKIRSKFLLKATTHKKLDVAKLQSEEIHASLIHSINNLEPLSKENMLDNTAKDVIGIKRRKHRDWFDENDVEIQCLLKKKQQLHNKTLIPNLAAVEKETVTEAIKETLKACIIC